MTEAAQVLICFLYNSESVCVRGEREKYSRKCRRAENRKGQLELRTWHLRSHPSGVRHFQIKHV